MFEANSFKKAVKTWMHEHPSGTELELTDYCEELIPAQQYTAYSWMVDHTLAWYRHVLKVRNQHSKFDDYDDDAA